MRRFEDGSGREWEVVAGRESWGAIFAIFIPRGADTGDAGSDGTPAIRQTPLQAASYGEATTELDTLTVEGLRALLDRSVPKNTG